MAILNIKLEEDNIMIDNERNPFTTLGRKAISLFGIPIYNKEYNSSIKDNRAEWDSKANKKTGF
jgi:hypothetical protein